MATSQSLIDRAARLVGAVNSGVSCTAAESADGLIALNAMLEAWQIEKLDVYAFVDTAYSLVAATSSYTVGPAGNFALTPRPYKIEECFVRVSGIDYPVDLLTAEQWFAIPIKTDTATYPDRAYYEPTLPTGTLIVYPVPSAVSSLHIVTWQVVSNLAALSTTISLPPGYERAITYNLAIEWAGTEFGLPPSNDVRKIAQDSLAAIQRANHRPILNYSPMGRFFAGQRSNILTDT
jgi:hypothetical protein